MRNIILLALILFTGFAATAQKSTSVVKSKETNEPVFVKVENDAHVDQKRWNEYLKQRLPLPQKAAAEAAKGTYAVRVQFIIDKDGYIGQVKALDDPGYGIAEHAVSIIKNYPGTWVPASQCGRQVKSYKTQLLTFVVD